MLEDMSLTIPLKKLKEVFEQALATYHDFIDKDQAVVAYLPIDVHENLRILVQKQNAKLLYNNITSY